MPQVLGGGNGDIMTLAEEAHKTFMSAAGHTCTRIWKSELLGGIVEPLGGAFAKRPVMCTLCTA